MKIVIILPDLRGGGAEKVCINLANDWIKNGHEVQFLLMNKKGEYLNKISKKIRIISFEKKKIRQLLFPLAKYFFFKKPDIILVNMWPLTSLSILSWLLSFKKGKLYVVDHVHLSSSITKELFISKFFFKHILSLTYTYANKIITVSNGVRKDILKINFKLNNKIKVIYNPIVKKKKINICLKNKKKKIEKIWGNKKIYKILAVGSLKIQKDFFNLIKAFSKIKKIKNAKLLIIGEGPLKKTLLEYCAKINISNRVIFLGFKKNLGIYYSTADLFVSSSRWEGFSNVIVEALSFGLPIVATNCPSGPSEILSNGKFGTLVPVNNSNKLAMAIEKISTKKVNKNVLINRSNDFEISKISKKYINIFNEKN